MTELAITDAILRHSLQIMRLSAGQEEEVDKVLREMARELELLLKYGRLEGASKRDVEKLLSQANEAIRVGYLRADAATDTHELAVIVAEKAQEIIEDSIPVPIAMPTDATLRSLTQDVLIDGAPSSAWWAKQADDTSFRFAAQVRQGVVNGETQEQIVARITGRMGEPGIMDIARRNARALVHSSVMTAANRARLEVFRKNGRFIKGVRWLATLDSHTCLTCGALDGQAWDLDGKRLKGTRMDFDAPPKHFGCRCVLTPIPKSFRDIGIDIPEPQDEGQRASSAGPVDGKVTFADFLDRQPAAFVDEVLGKKRADLWRAGKITLRDLVSGTGRALTLDELRVK